MNPRGRLTTPTGKPLKKYYNQCFECVDRGYRYSQGQPQIWLAVHRGLSREENEAREARIEERTEVDAARRLQRLQNEQVAEVTRQAAAHQADDASAQDCLFNEYPDPAHRAEAMDCNEEDDLWEDHPQDMSKE